MSAFGPFDSAGCDGCRRRGQMEPAEFRSPATGRSAPSPVRVAARGPSRSRRATITMAANRASESGLAGSSAGARRDMPSQTPTSESESYLFVISDGQEDVSHNTVFYRAADAELAASICRLCEREYGSEVRFSHRLSSSFSPDDLVLLDEALDELIIYDDPDPGVYDPPPTRQTLFRAQCARRCQRWEEMLKNRRTPADAPAQPVPQMRSAGSSESQECRLTDDDLLKICGIAHDNTELTAEHIAELRRVACLIGPRYVGTGASVELALSLLASVLGSFPRHNPTHLPFGYQGPTIKSHGWLDRDALERTAKQIVGLMCADCSPDRVAFWVEHAISEAIRLGFMEEKQYDAWRPGMRSGSGWRSAVMATPYGTTKARACSETAPPARPPRPGCARPDVANGWTFEPLDEGEVRASNQRLCSDYAAMDEHDLLTISEKWRQMASKFTEATKRTGHYHGHIVHEDEVLRVTKIIETAAAQRQIEGVNRLGRCLRRPDDGHLHWALATLDELDARLRAEASTKETEKPEDKDSNQTPVRELAAALQELRLATGELLHRSEKVDIYPEPEIKTYYHALRDAESRVNGISSHLAYGRENPGQIETNIRETLHNLSSAVEHVASDYNDRPGAYPLPKETTAPGWKALKGLMPIEAVLAMTTMKPGDLKMPVEDRRVSGLILLMLLAQAYYKMLECVISMASWCSALDVELNQSYLWVTSSLTNLLKNHDDLKDFPVEFKPIFDDLYPSTVRDVDWEDMVAPQAERFLSTVQKYVHEKGLYEPEEGSTASTFVQLFRPSVETAISRALDYHKRMSQYAQKAFGGVSAGGSTEAGGANNAAGEIKESEETAAGGAARAGTTVTQSGPGTPAASSDDRYEWARQIDLVRATNQVLGEGMLNKGVLSRACAENQVETNGKAGRGARVRVRSFLTWVSRQNQLGADEATQIRNAVIGEISSRNS